MSNPAVITLAHVRTNIGDFQVEDNVGESIHLHVGEIRCDLTIKEFLKLSDDVELALEKFLKSKKISVDKFSPEFLLQLAEANRLTEIESIEDGEVKLGDIVIDTYNWAGYPVLRKLGQSRVLKALKGNPCENNRHIERNFYGEDNQSRIDSMLESIKSNGYPYNGKKIVLLKGNNKILDGQHRAACMYYLWGDKKIPVIRLSFSNSCFTSQNSLLECVRFFKKITIRSLKRIWHLRVEIPIKVRHKYIYYACKWDKYRFRNVK